MSDNDSVQDDDDFEYDPAYYDEANADNETYLGETGSGPVWMDERFLKQFEEDIRKIWPPEASLGAKGTDSEVRLTEGESDPKQEDT